MSKRLSLPAPILAVLFILAAVFLGTYVTAYFLMGSFIDGHWTTPPVQRAIIREYPYKWQKTAFTPLAMIEGWIRGDDFVGIDSRSPDETIERAK